MARKPKRPRLVTVGPIRLRAIRGPHKDGAGRWYWRGEVHSDGGSRTVWTGWATRKEVEREAAGLLVSGCMDATRRAPRRAGAIRDLLEVYVAAQEARADLRPATVHARRTACRRLVRVLGDVRLGEEHANLTITEDYRNCRTRMGYAGRTILQDIEVLRSAWRWGCTHGVVKGAPPPRVRVKVEPCVSRYTPTPGEVAAVLAELWKLDRRNGLAAEFNPKWPWLMIWLQYATGARLSEVGALRVGSVDLPRGVLRVDGKTGPREVPVLDPALVGELVRWTDGRPADAMLLTVSLRGAKGVAKYLNAACDRAGVPRFTTHALRRLAVDTLARAGVEVATAAAILGHSPAVMLNVYRTVSHADRLAGVRKAGLGALPAGEVMDFRGRRRG